MGDWSDLNGSSYSPSFPTSEPPQWHPSMKPEEWIQKWLAWWEQSSQFISRQLGLRELRDEDLRKGILNCIHSLDYEESVDGILKDIANE